MSIVRSSLNVHKCDFCGKNQHEVGAMLANNHGVAICDDCMHEALLILLDKAGAPKVMQFSSPTKDGDVNEN